MDQDAFRKLVSSSTPSSSTQRTGASSSRGSILPSRTGKKAESTKGEAVKPEFKPRKVNKGKGAGYRDRAAERRQGVAGDFAQAEELLEKFELQHADDEDREAVEEKRRYLGGDLEHTVLVKGLDVALMEQVRARDASKSNKEEESLENAFRAVASSHASENNTKALGDPKGKKRTREDMIRELKEKRAKGGEEGKGIEEAKQEGKFKPIGFKPIGSAGKKAKDKEGVKKKKKQKFDVDAKEGPRRSTEQRDTSGGNSNTSKPCASLSPSATREPEAIDDDDIFADAGEYEGLKLEDDEDASGEEGEVKGDTGSRQSPNEREEEHPVSEAPRKWFEEDDEMPVDEDGTQDKGKQPVRASEAQHNDDHDKRRDDDEQEEESERMVRLAPLQSSTSIRDILAADEALEAEERRKARKEKRKAGGDIDGGEEKKKKKVSAETKLNREYKKLQAYTEKKGQQ